MKTFRQGDVLLLLATEIPANARIVAAEHGRVILARGEASGHHHSFAAGTVALFRPDDMPSGSGGWIEVSSAGAVLEHQEHDPVALPPGIYRQAVQVEETPKVVRLVVD